MKRSLLIIVLFLALSVAPVSADVGSFPYPLPPPDVQATDGTEVNRIKVTWSASPSAGASYYRIWRQPSGGSVWTNIATLPAVMHVFYDTSAAHNTVWRYMVMTGNVNGQLSDASNIATGYAGLGTVTNVDATDGDYKNRVWVDWDEVDGATGYEVRTAHPPSYYYKTTDTLYPWHNDYDLDPGILYYFSVRATNSVDEGEISSPYETGYRRLDEPNNVQATDGTYCDKTRVTWDAVEGATSYKVRRGDPWGATDDFTVSGSTQYDDNTCAASTLYTYWVFACADTGCSYLSVGDHGYRGLLLAPEGTDATDGVYPDKVRVTWDAVPGASSYMLQRSLLPNPYETIAEGIVANQYDDTDVVQGRTYYYRVAACNACGCGSYGQSDYGSTEPSTPTPTPTTAPTNTSVPTITPTRTSAPTITPTRTSDPTITPTRTSAPRATPTSSGVPTATPTSTPTQDHGPWDANRVSAPRVIHGTDGYRMWYDGYNVAYSEWGIGLARSSDCCTWWKHAGNPVLSPGEEGAWDSGGRMQVSVFKDSSVYKMWYSAHAGGVWQTGYATSPDGIDWDVYAWNPVLTVGRSGAWDEFEANAPAVIKQGGVYKMWFHGCNEGYEACAIGYASSPDGVNWTKHTENPVLEGESGEWDEGIVGSPAVILNGSTYEMWYWGSGGIGRATSSDGTHWTKDANNPVLSTGWNGLFPAQPFVLLEGGTYKMWFRQGPTSDSSIGYAESPDGVHWTLSPCNPVLIPGPMGGLWLPMIMRG